MNAITRLTRAALLALLLVLSMTALTPAANAATAEIPPATTQAPAATAPAPAEHGHGDHDHGTHDHNHPAGNGGAAPGHKPVNKRSCTTEFKHVKGQGKSCRVTGGLWKVAHSDGTFSLTHGPDQVAASGIGNLVSPARRPRCETSATAPRHVAVIAYPYDVVPDETVTTFRNRINLVNGELYASAVESGSPQGADFKFACDTAGNVRVDVVKLASLHSSQGTFSTIKTALKNLGYNKSNEKYAVWYEASAGSASGQGDFIDDLTDGASNYNNVNTGGMFAFVYNSGTSTLMHEMGHNHGAVQDGMPYSTGSWNVDRGAHCYEGLDVMCYNDGGADDGGSIVWNCNDRTHFDCNHNTYFDAKIGAGQGGAAGSMIDRNWNAGECYNRFIVNYVCTGGTTTPTDTIAPTTTVPIQSIYQGGTAAGGNIPVTFGWGASDASGIRSYEVWLSIDGTWYSQLAATTAKSVRWGLTPGSSYGLAYRATDTAGNTSAWVYGPTFQVLSVQDSNTTSIRYAGTWRAYSGTEPLSGTMRYSGTAGSTASMTFTGRAVSWVATRAVNRGIGYVYIDGTYVGSVDSYASATQWRSVVFARSWASSGTHTITIKVAGTSGRPTIDLDAFAILR